jgi:hypothetical protein
MLSWAASLLLGKSVEQNPTQDRSGRQAPTFKLPRLRLDDDDFGDDGADDSTAFLDEKNGPRAVNIVAGPNRSLVRTPSHPKTPPRRTAAEKVAFLEWLTSESCITEAADQFDCGCGLYEEGCYNRLVVTLMARKQLATLMKSRRVRFSQALAKLKPRTLVELRNACVCVSTGVMMAVPFTSSLQSTKQRCVCVRVVQSKKNRTTRLKIAQHNTNRTTQIARRTTSVTCTDNPSEVVLLSCES